mmetsp:Transcript_22567/g.40879  ORF Transcript_22567/g.40879 Transcript_22567/m.40879 type:complete len:335 (+) Transcript_22567:63-1067(+)
MGSGASATPKDPEVKVGDSVQVPGKGEGKIIEMSTTDVQLKFKDGNKNWYDMEEVCLMKAHAEKTHKFHVGDAVHVPGKGKVCVIESTTTDVQVKYEDGTSVWHDIDDLTKLLHQSVNHELRKGDTIILPGDGEVKVVDTTTTDLMLQLSDGSMKSYDVEDFKALLDKALEAAVGGLKVGSSLKVPGKGGAKVVEMNTTDIQLQFEDGSKKWYDAEDLQKMLSLFLKKGDTVEIPGKGMATVTEATTTDVQLKFGDDSSEWYDLEDLFEMLSTSISHDVRQGDSVKFPDGEEATIVEKTTTDVQVQYRDGSKKTYDVEDFDKLLTPKAADGAES